MTRLLIGLIGGLYTFDLVASRQRSVLPGVQPMAFAMDPSEPERVYCATYNRGLWRSEDAGTTWLPVRNPAGLLRRADRRCDWAARRRPSCRSIPTLLRRMAGMLVWVGTEPSRLYRSTDHGDTALNSCPRSTCRPAVAGPFLHGRGLHHVQCIAHTSDGCVHLAISKPAQ